MREGNRTKLVLWGIFIVLAGYLSLKGLSFDKETFVWMGINLEEQAVEVYLPSILESDGKDASLSANILSGLFVRGGINVRSISEQAGADSETDRKIIKENEQFLVENLTKENQEAGPKEKNQESTGMDSEEKSAVEENMQENTEESTQENTEEKIEENAGTENGQKGTLTAGAPVMDLPLEQFQDFNFVISNFYTIDKTTSINSEQLNAVTLLEKDLRMSAGAENPQILIYHSHSQEEFADSVPGDASTMIVGVGEYLTTLLRDTYGYNVMHVTDTFDIMGGKLDRNKAYNYAQETISRILEENPSIEVVIDLHRDSVENNIRLRTKINGKSAAQIMFFNGVSRLPSKGDIGYLYNPNKEANLAFSLQMQLLCGKYYPDLTRRIYIKGYRYNLHLAKRAMLVEVGAQNNTVEEAKNAMKPLAEMLYRLLSGEKSYKKN